MNSEFHDRIHEIYNAYLEGHFEYLVDKVVDDDIEFVSDAAHAFPYFAQGKGKDVLLAAWKASRADYEFLNYAPFLVVAESRIRLLSWSGSPIGFSNRPYNGVNCRRSPTISLWPRR